MHGVRVAVQQTGAVEFAQNAHDATGTVHVFHVHVRHGGGDLAQAGHVARQAVDVRHGEIDARFARGGQQVQHGV